MCVYIFLCSMEPFFLLQSRWWLIPGIQRQVDANFNARNTVAWLCKVQLSQLYCLTGRTFTWACVR